MWCDNCNYMPKEYEEKYMICPNCNTYIERNLPESPVKRQLVYNNSSKIIRLKKTISYILLLFCCRYSNTYDGYSVEYFFIFCKKI